MRTIIFIGILACLTFNRCSKISTSESSQAIASVDGKALTIGELQKAIPKNLSKNDSLAFTQNYISRWVKSSLLLRKAELNLSPEEKDVKQILEDYRASLLIHKYQQKLLLEKHSPLITNKEIEEYYNTMNENFILNEDIIKGIFIKIPRNAPNIAQLKKWYRSENPEDMVKLEEYCYLNAKNFDIFLDKWVTVDAISKLLPKPIPKNANFLKYNKFYEVSDSTSQYLVSFRDYHKTDEIAPIQYVTEKIKAILLNKKRIEFIQNLEEELYQEGLKQKVIKFY